MTATETLQHEHRIILKVLEATEHEVQGMQNTGKMDAEKLKRIVDFFRNFIDHCHHTKEEQHLFVRMQERGMSKNNSPVAVMLQEHEQGRQIVKAVGNALLEKKRDDPSTVVVLKDNLSAYVGLLRSHIDKEDNVLYPMANQLFNQEDQEALLVAFERVETEEIGEEVHEKYHQLAHDLMKS